MATYAIGDIQGCLQPLNRLLEIIQFDPSEDYLWIAGDLVNRGPNSLGVLRTLYQLKERCTIVLGNHDLHLLAFLEGKRSPSKSDTLTDIVDAPDKSQLINWLKQQPLFHHDANLGYSLVHAGLHPQWSIQKALRLSQEVQTALQGPDYTTFLETMYGNQPDQWQDDLSGMTRLRVITNYFTRLRFCHADGRMDFDCKSDQAPQGLIPWFDLPKRKTQNDTIIFGHWATLQGQTNHPHAIALDTGCVWGYHLTAMRLEDQALFQTPNH